MSIKILGRFYRHPKLTLILFFLISLFFAGVVFERLFDGQSRLILDTSFEPFFDNSSPAYVYSKQMEQEFGSENILLIALAPTPIQGQQRLDLEFFLNLKKLRDQLKARPLIESLTSLLDVPQTKGDCLGKSYFHRLRPGGVCLDILTQIQANLACLKKGIPDPIEASPLALDSFTLDSTLEPRAAKPAFACTQAILNQGRAALWLAGEDETHQVLEKIKATPLIRQDLLSFDANATAIIVRLYSTDPKQRNQELADLEKIFADYRGMGMQIYYSGLPREELEVARLLLQDLSRLIPASLVLLTCMTFLSFRSLTPPLLLLGNLALGLLWTAGVFGLSGARLNLITLVLPPLVTTVGTSYAIHVLAQYIQAAKKSNLSKTEVIERTLEKVSLPILLALITTLLGFFALVLSPIPAIREMGIFASVGIFFMAAFAMVVLPCGLYLLPRPALESAAMRRSFFEALLTRLGALVTSQPRPILWVFLTVTLTALLGATQVRVDSKTQNFPARSKITQDHQYLQTHFGGTDFIRLVFSSKDEAGQLERAATVQGLVALKKWLAQQALLHPNSLKVHRMYSPLEYLEILRGGLDHLNDEEVRFYFNRMEKGYGALFFNSRHSLLSVTLRVANQSTAGYLAFQEKLQEKLKELFPHLQAKFTGNVVLSAESAHNIAQSQIISLGLALAFILVVLSLLFFSFKVGFLALLPNVAAILLFFGLLGFSGTPISAILSVIGAIALGIGVDDSIHFITHFNQNLNDLKDPKEAAEKTLRSVGKPMIYTTLALMLGFGVLMASEVTGQASFGWLTAFTLFLSLLSNLFLLPALLVRVRFFVIWDYLNIRYSSDFIQSINLFQNMSLVESRLVTLVGETKDYQAGEIIFQENDEGKELFIILEGAIEVYFDEKYHGENRLVDLFKRGQVFGEMALFEQGSRMDSARAIVPSKLLLLNKHNLTRLKDSFPQTALKLYLNLCKNLSVSIYHCQLKLQDHANSPSFAPSVGKPDLFHALTKIRSMRGPTVETKDNWPRFRDYYQRLFPPHLFEGKGELSAPEDYLRLVNEVLEKKGITYYQRLLLKRFSHLGYPLKKEENQRLELLIAKIRSGEVVEIKPSFSNLFQGLGAKELDWIEKKLEIKEVPQDSTLFSVGEYSDSMLVVLRGRIHSFASSPPEGETPISVLSSGDIIGETALFVPDYRREVTAIAVEPTQIFYLSSRGLEKLIKENKKLGATLTYNLVGIFLAQLRRCLDQAFG